MELGDEKTSNSGTVAFLGPLSSNSHFAAESYFPTVEPSSFIPSSTIPEIFTIVASSTAQFGVVPFENTIGGRIHQALEGFAFHPEIKICGQLYLRVSHHCLSKSPFEALKKIYSHPQALAQCSHFLLTHCPHLETIPVSSTARAAELAALDGTAGAISAKSAAAHFGLNILYENIQDDEENVTRFFIISKSIASPTAAPFVKDNTFLMFQTGNVPGALEKALCVFTKYYINLCRLDSFPCKGETGTFNFLVEIEGHPSSSPLKEAIPKLEQVTTLFRVLGAFSQTEENYDVIPTN